MPRITVGLPIYKAADLIPETLRCLQRQTVQDFEAIISVDGNDQETATACKPFLRDRRFRMIVHPMRLDWVGNFNWLLQQDLSEFFCYRQHDDTTTPDFFERLLRCADSNLDAAAIYSDCQFFGVSNHREGVPSITGDPLDRLVQYIERPLSAVPLRGLIKRAAIRKVGLVRTDEYRAPMEVYVWLAKLLQWGDFQRVEGPLYFKLDHPRNFSNEFLAQKDEKKRAASATLFTGLLEATMPVCQTAGERLYFQHAIVDRLVAWPYRDKPAAGFQFMKQCLERLKNEGNQNLLGAVEIATIWKELEQRLAETNRSRWRRVLSRTTRRLRMGKRLHPNSLRRRIGYHRRHLVDLRPSRILGGMM